MSIEGEIACPRCGAVYRPEEGEHICAVLDDELHSEGVNPELQSVAQEATDFGRIVTCPFCSNTLDVSMFNPLDQIECCHCKQHFEVLRHFGNGLLTEAVDTGVQHPIYLAKDIMGEGNYIVQVLSAHFLAQPDCVLDFLKHCQDMISRCRAEMVKFTDVKSESGFLHLLIALQDGISPHAMLSELGIQINLHAVPHYPVAPLMKYDLCPSCQQQVDAMALDPLDEARCAYCGNTFQILRQLGEYRLDYKMNIGGTSKLYLAEDLKNKRKVALKVLTAAEMQRNPDSTESLLKEVELTKRLRHPNVIQIYDGGQIQGFYYMSMELVDGLTLNHILHLLQPDTVAAHPHVDMQTNRERFKQGIPELVCIEIALQTAAGLGIAHQNGLVHGDVKPENIMVTFEGVVKVLDFGLVRFENAEKMLDENGEDVAIFGTPFYIPPERVMGEPEDFRSDIYSLGATLYHLIRGIAPFRAKSAEEIAVMHASSPMVKFKAFVPWVSDTTARIIERSMSKNVNDRYTSHIEFIADLTLAKNQVLQNMGTKPVDSLKTIKTFMTSLPIEKKSGSLWQKAATVGIHTYKFATMAITNRVRGIVKAKRS